MAIDNKYFVGGLNSDDEDRVIPNGDYRYALNIRNSKSDSDSQGSIENVKGNELVYYNLGQGSYKTIGAYDDKLNNKIYYFVWGSNLDHKILEFEVNTNTINKVLESDVLNFQPDQYILSTNVAIIDNLMFWVDGSNINPPMKINIDRAKNNGYPNPLLLSHIEAAIIAPNNPPTSIYGSDTSVPTNNVRGKLFQFRYKWIYEDNEGSAWSPISKISLPIDEAQYRPFSYYPTTLNNYIKIGIDVGNELVKRVKIAFREGNTGDFYLAKDLDKSKISLLPTSTSYDYDFYNDETATILDNDGNKGMRLFDWMARFSNTQAIIDDNRIVYGGITEQFDPVDIDIDINPNYTTSPNIPAPAVRYNSYAQSVYGVLYWLSTNGNTLLQWTQSTLGATFAIIVNGYKYRQTRFGNYSGLSPQPFYSNSTSDCDITYWAFDNDTSQNARSVRAIMNEFLFDRPNGGGVRYILNINVNYYNFGTRRYEAKTFKIQYTSTATDTEYDVAVGLKNALASQSFNDDYIRIEFTNIFAGGGGTYQLGVQPTYGQGGTAGTTGSNTGVLKFTVRGYCPQTFISTDGINAGWFALDAPALTSVVSGLQTFANWTTKVEKTLKAGATHGVGIVYYDEKNRSGLTNITDKKLFYVKHPSERGLLSNTLIGSTNIEVDINHEPPSWATHYQFVYTGNQTCENVATDVGYKGFIQCRLNNFANSSISGAVQATLNELTIFNNSTPEVTGLGYGFTKGDRIRFISDANGNYLNTYEDVEVISFDKSTELLTFKKPTITLGTNYLVEIYTPKKKTEKAFYYEIGEVYKCGNGIHEGNTQNQQFDLNGNLIQPAKVLLEDIGDVYLRYRTTTNRQIEDYHYSDYYDSDSWDKGRTNIVDNNIKKTYRPTTIRYSQPYVPETNINGLSQFNDFDFETYNQKYGDIKLLYPEDKLLNIFQKLKVGAIGIRQDVVYGDAGEVVSTSRNENKVLSQSIRYYAGEFGIGNNPESFAVYGNAKYFTDAKRGVVCRLGGDGITPISEYKMHNYFTDTFESLDTNTLPYNIFAAYDMRFDELVLNITNGVINDTVVFSEGKNRWVSFHSYSPDFMVSNRTGLITFFNGQLYKHNTNSLYNNFYGIQNKSQIKFISNVEPNKVKVFTNITEDSTDVWSMSEATNQYGQKTSLIVDDFEDVEGVYKAALLRDENTPNEQYPLIEGDVMRSHSLVITLDNNSVDFQKLFSVGVGVTLSELTNR